MPEVDIHLRLAALEADVASLRNFITAEFGHDKLPPARIDHPSITQATDVTEGMLAQAAPDKAWPERATGG